MTEYDQENVILVTYDSVRVDHCGHGGYERNTTPNMDTMAEEGIDFQQAISPASRTNPSMSGIMTGKPLINREMVSKPEISRRHLKRYGTIAEEFSKKGYSTAGFCPNAYTSRYYGFDRGFDYFEDFLFTSDLYQKLFSKHISDSGFFTTLRNIRNLLQREEAFRTWDTYVDDVIEWADNQDGPFFIWIFALDTHYPYITPRKYRKWSNAWKTYYYNYQCNSLINEFDVSLSEREKQGIIDIYDDALQYGDRLLGELTDRLSDHNPTYIVHSDHGEAFDEHGFYGHFYPSLYNECTRVPYVVWKEGIKSKTISKPFSLLNTPKVVRTASEGELVNFETETNTALSTTFDGRRDRNLVSYHIGNYKVVTKIENGESKTEVYDLSQDPSEQTILTNKKKLVKSLQELTASRFAHEEKQLEVSRAAKASTDNL